MRNKKTAFAVRLLSVILAISAIIGVGSVFIKDLPASTVYADGGTGAIPGTGSSSNPVTGTGGKYPYTSSEYLIAGYRISLYDMDGTKLAPSLNLYNYNSTSNSVAQIWTINDNGTVDSPDKKYLYDHRGSLESLYTSGVTLVDFPNDPNGLKLRGNDAKALLRNFTNSNDQVKSGYDKLIEHEVSEISNVIATVNSLSPSDTRYFCNSTAVDRLCYVITEGTQEKLGEGQLFFVEPIFYLTLNNYNQFLTAAELAVTRYYDLLHPQTTAPSGITASTAYNYGYIRSDGFGTSNNYPYNHAAHYISVYCSVLSIPNISIMNDGKLFNMGSVTSRINERQSPTAAANESTKGYVVVNTSNTAYFKDASYYVGAAFRASSDTIFGGSVKDVIENLVGVGVVYMPTSVYTLTVNVQKDGSAYPVSSSEPIPIELQGSKVNLTSASSTWKVSIPATSTVADLKIRVPFAQPNSATVRAESGTDNAYWMKLEDAGSTAYTYSYNASAKTATLTIKYYSATVNVGTNAKNTSVSITQNGKTLIENTGTGTTAKSITVLSGRTVSLSSESKLNPAGKFAWTYTGNAPSPTNVASSSATITSKSTYTPSFTADNQTYSLIVNTRFNKYFDGNYDDASEQKPEGLGYTIYVKLGSQAEQAIDGSTAATIYYGGISTNPIAGYRITRSITTSSTPVTYSVYAKTAEGAKTLIKSGTISTTTKTATVNVDIYSLTLTGNNGIASLSLQGMDVTQRTPLPTGNVAWYVSGTSAYMSATTITGASWTNTYSTDTSSTTGWIKVSGSNSSTTPTASNGSLTGVTVSGKMAIEARAVVATANVDVSKVTMDLQAGYAGQTRKVAFTNFSDNFDIYLNDVATIYGPMTLSGLNPDGDGARYTMNVGPGTYHVYLRSKTTNQYFTPGVTFSVTLNGTNTAQLLYNAVTFAEVWGSKPSDLTTTLLGDAQSGLAITPDDGEAAEDRMGVRWQISEVYILQGQSISYASGTVTANEEANPTVINGSNAFNLANKTGLSVYRYNNSSTNRYGVSLSGSFTVNAPQLIVAVMPVYTLSRTATNSAVVVTRSSSPVSVAPTGTLSDSDELYQGDSITVTMTANSGYYYATTNDHRVVCQSGSSTLHTNTGTQGTGEQYTVTHTVDANVIITSVATKYKSISFNTNITIETYKDASRATPGFANWATVSTESGSRTINNANDTFALANVASVNVKGGSAIGSSLPSPSVTGWTFDGWYTSASGGTKVTSSTTFSTDTTLYARWTPKTGSNSPASVKRYSGASTNVKYTLAETGNPSVYRINYYTVTAQRDTTSVASAYVSTNATSFSATSVVVAKGTDVFFKATKASSSYGDSIQWTSIAGNLTAFETTSGINSSAKNITATTTMKANATLPGKYEVTIVTYLHFANIDDHQVIPWDGYKINVNGTEHSMVCSGEWVCPGCGYSGTKEQLIGNNDMWDNGDGTYTCCYCSSTGTESEWASIEYGKCIVELSPGTSLDNLIYAPRYAGENASTSALLFEDAQLFDVYDQSSVKYRDAGGNLITKPATITSNLTIEIYYSDGYLKGDSHIDRIGIGAGTDMEMVDAWGTINPDPRGGNSGGQTVLHWVAVNGDTVTFHAAPKDTWTFFRYYYENYGVDISSDTPYDALIPDAGINYGDSYNDAIEAQAVSEVSRTFKVVTRLNGSNISSSNSIGMTSWGQLEADYGTVINFGTSNTATNNFTVYGSHSYTVRAKTYKNSSVVVDVWEGVPGTATIYIDYYTVSYEVVPNSTLGYWDSTPDQIVLKNQLASLSANSAIAVAGMATREAWPYPSAKFEYISSTDSSATGGYAQRSAGDSFAITQRTVVRATFSAFEISADNAALTITAKAPVWKGSFVYNGASQSADNTALWTRYNATYLAMGDTKSATNAGTYSAAFGAKGYYNSTYHTYTLTGADGGTYIAMDGTEGDRYVVITLSSPSPAVYTASLGSGSAAVTKVEIVGNELRIYPNTTAGSRKIIVMQDEVAGFGDTSVEITFTLGYVGTTANWTIAQKAITIKADDAAKVYDGSALTKNSYSVTSGSLVSGHAITATISGTVTNVGSATNTLSAVVIKSGSTDVTANYAVTMQNGMLEVTVRPITITGNTASYVYDGNPHTVSGGTVTSGSLVTGHTMTCSGSATRTEVGQSDYIPSSAVIKSGSTDVTSNYSISYANGWVKIQQPPLQAITITAASDSKVYDGTALTKNSASLTSGSLMPGHTAIYSATGSQTNVGNSANVPSVVIKDSGNNDVTSWYTVTKVNGTLTVTPRQITVTGASDSKTYDGTALTKNSASLTSGTLATGHTAAYSATGSQTTVGNSANVPSVVIKSGTTDVTANYQITYVNGTLTVSARAITITGNTASYDYDGNPHTVSGGTVTSGSLAAGQTMTCSGSATRTEVGTTEYTPSSAVIKSGSTNVTSNYSITYQKGGVTITQPGAQPITITAASDSKVYDGTALTKNSASLTSGSLMPGHTATYSATGSQTNVGNSDNVPSVVIKDSGNNDVTSWYTVTKVNGTLTVTPRLITVTGASDSKTYDGTALTKNSASLTSGTLATGHTATYSATGSQTNVGNSNNVPSVVIKSGTTDVTANYQITYVNGTLTVSARAITITGNTASYVYDGNPHTVSGGTVTSGSLVTGQTMTCSGSATRTEVGQSDYIPSSAVIKSGSTDVTSNYSISYANGWVKIQQPPLQAITITAASDSKVYDGTALTKNSASLTSGSLMPGHTAIYSATGSQTNVGNSANVPSVVIKDSGNNDVTSWYTVTKVNGTLTVTPRLITVTGTSDSKTYDGTALTKNSASLTSGTLVTGHTATYSATGSQTNVGNSNNVPSVVIKSGTTDVTANYQITYVNGTLTVSARAITITGNTASYDYDGNPHTVSGGTVTSGSLASGQTMTCSGSATRTEVGTTEYTPSSAVIKSGSTNVTSNYSITYQKGGVTITQPGAQPITITAASDSKVYDGTALTKNSASLTSGTLMPGHTATYSATGSQTNVGNSANVPSVVIKDSGNNDVTSWYTVTKVNGTLTVTPRLITVTGASDSKTYDGTALTKNSASLTSGALVTGHTATYSATGSQTNVGHSNNVPSVVIKSGTTDVIANYQITYVNGTLTVSARAITITGNTASYDYDGNPHTVSGGTVTSGSLVSGQTMTCSGSATRTEVGTTEYTPSSAVIKSGSTNVTSNYSITYQKGGVTITQPGAQPITITAASDSKVYDGTALTKNSASLTSGTLMPGHTATYSATGFQTNAGNSANVPNVVIKDSGNNDVTSWYTVTKVNGTLTVTPRLITVTGASDSKTYDGTALTKNSASLTSGSLPTGQTATYSATGSQTNVGNSNNVPSVVIKSGTTDVTANYQITYVNGTLTVNKRPITITGNSASYPFDGTMKTVTGATAPSSSLVTGHSVSSTSSASGMAVGTYDHLPNATNTKILSGTTDVSSNYEITFVKGTLTISTGTSTAITITGNKIEVVYDGAAHTASGGTVTSGALLTGHTLVSVSGSVTRTNAGTSTYTPSGAVIKNAGGVDVTSMYTITYAPGEVKIKKRPITITGASDNKTYDGTPLTKNEASLTSGTLVPGQTPTYSATGSITNAGTENNVPSVIIKSGTTDVTSNYEITVINGTLTVDPRPITVKADDAAKVYDGSELTKKTVTVTSGSVISGHTITPTITSTITNVGTKANAIDSIKIMSGTTDVTSNYVITPQSGTLTISKRPITITGNTASEIYDGNPHTVSGGTVTSGSLVTGQTMTCSGSATRTAAGTSTYTPSNAVIKAGTTDVTSNYDITYAPGSITITINNYNLTVIVKVNGSNTATTNSVFVNGTVQTTATATYSLANGTAYTITARPQLASGTAITYATGTLTADTTVTVNYYTVTLDKGAYIDAVSGAGTYLAGQSPAISATVQSAPAYSDATGQVYAYGKATVHVYLNDSTAYDPGTLKIKKSDGTGSMYTLTKTSTGVYTSDEVPAGTYTIYVNDTATYATVTVNNGTQTVRTNYAYSFDKWTKNTAGTDLTNASNASTTVTSIDQESRYKADGKRTSSTEYLNKVPGGSSEARVDYYSVTTKRGSGITSTTNGGTTSTSDNEKIYLKGSNVAVDAAVASNTAYNLGDIKVLVTNDDVAWGSVKVYLSTSATTNTKTQTGTTAANGTYTFTSLTSGTTYYLWTDGGYTNVSAVAPTGTTAYAWQKWTGTEEWTDKAHTIAGIAKQYTETANATSTSTRGFLDLSSGATKQPAEYVSLITYGDAGITKTSIDSVEGSNAVAVTVLKGSTHAIDATVRSAETTPTKAKVYVDLKLDGSAWTGQTVYLEKGGSWYETEYNATLKQYVSKISLDSGKYNVYVNGKAAENNTNKSIDFSASVTRTYSWLKWSDNNSTKSRNVTVNAKTTLIARTNYKDVLNVTVNGVNLTAVTITPEGPTPDPTPSPSPEPKPDPDDPFNPEPTPYDPNDPADPTPDPDDILDDYPVVVKYYSVTTKRGTGITSTTNGGTVKTTDNKKEYLEGTNVTIDATLNSTGVYNFGTIKGMVKLDDSAWNTNVYLSTSATTNSKTKTATAVAGVFTFATLPSGTTYYIWTDIGYTGVSTVVPVGSTGYGWVNWTGTETFANKQHTISGINKAYVETANAQATDTEGMLDLTANPINYYTVTTYGDYGIATTSVNGKSGSNNASAIVLRGQTATIDATAKAAETNNAKVIVRVNLTKDGTAWSGQDVDLYSGATKVSDTTYSGGVYVANTALGSGTYNVWVNGENTGKTVSFTATNTRTFTFKTWKDVVGSTTFTKTTKNASFTVNGTVEILAKSEYTDVVTVANIKINGETKPDITDPQPVKPTPEPDPTDDPGDPKPNPTPYDPDDDPTDIPEIPVKYYTLKVNPDGGTWSGSTATQSFVMLEGATKAIGAPTKAGNVFLGWVESGDGYLDSAYTLTDGSFRNGNPLTVYNNSGGNAVTIVPGTGTITNALFTKYALTNYLVVANNGGTTAPGRGGWYKHVTAVADHQYIVMFIAKVPSGFSLEIAANSTGSGGHAMRRWLTDHVGTGDWQLYAYEVVAGSSGTFSTFGHTYLANAGGGNTYEVQLAYHNIVDLGATYGSPVYNTTYTNAGDTTLTAVWLQTETDVTVTKTWIDDSNAYNTRGSGATVRLVGKNTAGTKVYESSKTISAAATSATFTAVPVFDGTLGDKLTYTLTEDAMAAYDSEITGSVTAGYQVKNTQKTVALTVNTNLDGTLCSATNPLTGYSNWATVTWYRANGTTAGTATINAYTQTVNIPYGAQYAITAKPTAASTSANVSVVTKTTITADQTANVNYNSLTLKGDLGIASTKNGTTTVNFPAENRQIYLNGRTIAISATVRVGTFKTWVVESGNTPVSALTTNSNSVTLTQATVLKATTEVKITYILNGGTYGGSTASVTRAYAVGESIDLLTATPPTGKEFAGWFASASGTQFGGGIGAGGAKYTMTNDIVVYACYYTPLDLGITANTLFGSVKIGSPFVASATLINHSQRDLLPTDGVKIVVTVTDGSTSKSYTVTNSATVPKRNRNLYWQEIPTTGWDSSKTYTIIWTLDFSSAMIADARADNNTSRIVGAAKSASISVKTDRPDFSISADATYNKDTVPPTTSVNTYSWKQWTYTSGAFKTNSYSDRMNITLILKPENENGLRTFTYGPYNVHNYTTRSGYGFSIHSEFKKSGGTENDPVNGSLYSNIKTSHGIGQPYGYMTFPEFNFSREYDTANSKNTKISTLSFDLDGDKYRLFLPQYTDYTTDDINDQFAHYTPMWIANGYYRPVTYFGGLWSPVGEITATVKQGELTTAAQMSNYGVYTNSYTINGSLYDDIY